MELGARKAMGVESSVGSSMGAGTMRLLRAAQMVEAWLRRFQQRLHWGRLSEESVVSANLEL